MATNGGPLDYRKGCFVHGLAGLVFSTGGVLFQEPLFSLSLKGSDQTSIILPVYAYLFLLNPLTFYLNTLSLLSHVTTHTRASEVPLPVFLFKQLPRAARVVSFATLLVGTPLWMQAAVAEGSIGLAIGAMLVCIALVSILTSVFKKLLISCCHAGRGFVPSLFALCISTGFLIIFFDPLFSSFSNTNHYDPLIHIALHYLLLFVIFFVFMLGITLLILCISAPFEGQPAAIQAENLVLIALSVAFATLLLGIFLKVAFVAVRNMASVSVEAAEK